MRHTLRIHFSRLLWLLAPVLLYGCAGQRYAEFEQQTVDGLERVASDRVDVVYLRPDTEFGDYDKVMIKSVEIRFRKDWLRQHPDVSVAEQERIKQGLTQLFQETFRAELQKGDIPVVNVAGPDVLAVGVQLVDLYITHVDDLRADNTRVYVTSAGSVTLIGELFDSVSDEILARVADHRVARSTANFEISSRVSNTIEARRALEHWAALLRERLNAVQSE